MKTYADWGFDLLKYDWCKYGEVFNALPQEQKNRAAQQAPYRLIASFLARQKRDIQLNLCQYGMAEVWKWGAETGQSWRVGGDLGQGGRDSRAALTVPEPVATLSARSPFPLPRTIAVGWVGMASCLRVAYSST